MSVEPVPFYGQWSVTATYPPTGLSSWALQIRGTPGQDGVKPLPDNGFDWGFRGDAWTLQILTYFQFGGLQPTDARRTKRFERNVGLVVELRARSGSDIVPSPELHLRCVLQALNPISEGDPYDFTIPEQAAFSPI